MDFALKVMGRDNKDSSCALCVRQGEEPQVVKVDKPSMAQEVSDYIVSMYEKGYENIAVLCKSNDQCTEIRTGLKLPLAVEKAINLKVLPVYLAKGLEFDAVALWDVNADDYSRVNDKNIIYTAITRAMHNVKIFVGDKAPEFLQFVNIKLL